MELITIGPQWPTVSCPGGFAVHVLFSIFILYPLTEGKRTQAQRVSLGLALRAIDLDGKGERRYEVPESLHEVHTTHTRTYSL